jgi:hypothetical protein
MDVWGCWLAGYCALLGVRDDERLSGAIDETELLSILSSEPDCAARY